MTVVIPATSPVPKPIHIFMPPTSPANSAPNGPNRADGVAVPTASSIPVPARLYDSSGSQSNHDASDVNEMAVSSPSTNDKAKEKEPGFPKPKLRLEIRDLAHLGASRFLTAVNASVVMTRAVNNVQRLLYTSVSDPTTHCPGTRSVTVVLRDMGGVAYTTGSELDSDHKEIHFSLGYIASIQLAERVPSEIEGVLTHELVHCYQWNARGTCPGGLIEGIADWVRLCCNLCPPHWKREATGKWDGGYQHTAYFLNYLEGRFGIGTVRRINETLREREYVEKDFWTGLLGRPVEQLWGDYVDEVSGE